MDKTTLKILVTPNIQMARNALTDAETQANIGHSESARTELLKAKRNIQTALDAINGKPMKKNRKVVL